MNLNNIVTLTEPQWGENFLVSLNKFVLSDPILVRLVPFFADVFVFTYPLYLIYIYLYGIYKKDIESKIAALYIFSSIFVAVILNLSIQYLFDKARPAAVFLSQDKLILKHIPDKSFPSDHAGVSAAIAMATLIRGIRNKSKSYTYFGLLLWVFSIVMCLSRVAAGVHWPTDIIVGMLVGIFSSYILIWDKVFIFLKVKIFFPIIRLEKSILKIFGIRQ